MSTQPVTLNLPETLYERLRERAAQTNRSLEEETLEALSSAVPIDDELPLDLLQAIESVASLDDTGLWNAARSELATETAEELQALHDKRQREGLTVDESQQLETLIGKYERHMLTRAKAAALLKERGHDVGSLVAS